MQKNTTKYLLIAGVAAVGYYLYTRNSAAGGSVPTVTGQVNATDAAFVQSWATGLTGSNAVNFQNAFPSLSAADISQMASLIKAWEGLRALTDADYSFWASFQQRVGLV
jgi:hypothetical protein